MILCQMLGRAIVLVREDQLSLAIGRRGQNVRLASKLCGWDIEIMTREELEQQIERAVAGFSAIGWRRRRAGRTAGGRRLLDLRRSFGHRARRADGNGQFDRRAGATHRRSGRSKRPKRRKQRPRQSVAASASRNGSKRPPPRPIKRKRRCRNRWFQWQPANRLPLHKLKNHPMALRRTRKPTRQHQPKDQRPVKPPEHELTN